MNTNALHQHFDAFYEADGQQDKGRRHDMLQAFTAGAAAQATDAPLVDFEAIDRDEIDRTCCGKAIDQHYEENVTHEPFIALGTTVECGRCFSEWTLVSLRGSAQWRRTG